MTLKQEIDLKKKNASYPKLLTAQLKEKKLKGKVKELTNLMVKIKEGRFLDYQEALYEFLLKDSKNLKDVLANGVGEFFELTLSEEWAERFKQMLLRFNEYSYSQGVFRRSLHSKEINYLKKPLSNFLLEVYFNYEDFSLIDYLTNPESGKYGYYRPGVTIIENALALEIDLGNKQIIQLVKDIIYSENNTINMNHTITKAIIKSHNQELYQDLIQLLLAAKLQEGVRQMILESADAGTVDFLKLTIETIIEHDLTRFASCVRAINTWIGFGYAAENQRQIKQIIVFMNNFLKDETQRKQALEKRGGAELFTALWATGVYEAADCLPLLNKLFVGTKHQKLVAGYFLSLLQDKEVRTQIALEFIEEEDLDVFAYLAQNVTIGDNYFYRVKREEFIEKTKNNKFFQNTKTVEKLTQVYLQKVTEIPKTGYLVSQKPFDWSSYTLSRDGLFRDLISLVQTAGKEEYLEKLMETSKDADSNVRIWIIRLLLDPNNQKDKNRILSYLDDKSTPVREEVINVLKDVPLSKEELDQITALLRLKSGGIRQSIIELILKQEPSLQFQIIEQLVVAKEETKHLAALDLLLSLQKKDEVTSEQIENCVEKLAKVTEQEKILINQLLNKEDSEEYSKKNGFGLYDPDYRPTFEIEYEITGTLKQFKSIQLNRLKEIINQFVQFVEEHKEYVFYTKNWDKSRQERFFGSSQRLMITYENSTNGSQNKIDAKFSDYVLHEEIAQFIESLKITPLELMRIRYIDSLSNYRGEYNPSYLPWAKELIEEQLLGKEAHLFREWFNTVQYKELIKSIIAIYTKLANKDQIFEISYSILVDFILSQKNSELFIKNVVDFEKNKRKTEDEFILGTSEVHFFINRKQESQENPENFIKSIALSYKLGALQNYVYLGQDELGIARAVENGIIPINELYRTFFKVNPSRKMQTYTTKNNAKVESDFKQYPCLKIVKDAVVERVIEIEMKRGDSKTEVSEMANKIRVHYGIDHFVNILLALGKETFARGYIWGSSYTKKEVLSSLLKTCLPKEDETVEQFKEAIDGRITEKRLIEAVMYAPAWANYLEEYLGWSGVKSAIWYFHAHTSDSVSVENESEIAPFSPISRVDFQDGAFDINWFNATYKELGKKRFELFYTSAKYICSGGTHKRAQLFADAVMGKLKARTLEKEILDKRNKDKLLSYGLIPLGKNSEQEALKRYEFIHKFIKSGKEFGAQRRESEKKASTISLGNLARNLGYDDVNIFSWKMEVLKLEMISQYFADKKVGEYTVKLTIDEEGTADVVIHKEDTLLKSVPTKIKKDKYLLEVNEVKKSLKDQYSRARTSFETAMIQRTQFKWSELKALVDHPVIYAVMKKLVFKANNSFGFVIKEGLKDTEGKVIQLEEEQFLVVAHPYDLQQEKVWSDYQKYLFEQQLVQPFKQIFRELYTVNLDEKEEKTISRRYAGHQVQPQKTVALLKSRGWNVYYEEGLQKVDFKQNIIARMYAMADWFSPADTEAPTLETVEFFDRNSRENIEFESLDPVLFSETMRDIDLVVSIAHVGGVDPESSHSTIEMRKVLVAETIRLMKYTNVVIEGNFAKVIGQYGEYAIHLGSGLVQMMGKGNIHILAVQSQQRGRIFLPFLDEDPRTAEIVSKIALLAEDNKIKDPMILNQLQGN